MTTRLPVPAPPSKANLTREDIVKLSPSSIVHSSVDKIASAAENMDLGITKKANERQGSGAPPIPPRPIVKKATNMAHAPDTTATRLKNDAVNEETQRHSSPLDSASDTTHKPDFLDYSTLGRNIRAAALVPPSEATIRKTIMTNVYFLDYYFDLLTYLNQRKQRTQQFKDELASKQLTSDQKNMEWKVYCGRERSHLRKRRTRLRITAFNILKQVGQGGYGQVFLAKKKDTGELCALKKMSKTLLHKMGEVQHVLTERDILTRTETEWLVKLFYAFQDMENVYLAMEYVPGGDMRTLLNNSGVLREEHARFYVSEMVVSVAELHRLGYIHRDLKPENFLIDAKGHIKLTDFGLSRGVLSQELQNSLKTKLQKIKDLPYIYRSTAERRNTYKSVKKEDMRAFSQVGSPDYMAPEVLTQNGVGYSLAVDYWSIGCILFECLAGFPPFTAPTTDDVWVNVYHWNRVLERPIYSGVDEEFNLTDVAWDLVTQLINYEDRRLKTLESVQLHPFFINYPFSDLRNEQLGPEPPFIPKLKNSVDTSYFDDFSNPNDMAMYQEVRDRQAQMEAQMNGKTGGKGHKLKGSAGEDGLRAAFVGFTFKHRDSRQYEGDVLKTIL